MLGRAALLALSAAAVACGTGARTHATPPRGSSSASGRARPAGAPPRAPTVRVALLDTSGSAYGPSYQLEPDPVPLVVGCMGASGESAFLEGSALFDLHVAEECVAKVRRVVDLPLPLATCIADALGATRPGPRIMDTPESLVYVSIGAE